MSDKAKETKEHLDKVRKGEIPIEYMPEHERMIYEQIDKYDKDTRVQRKAHDEQLEKDWPQIQKEIEELLKDIPKTPKKGRGQRVKRK